MNTTSQHYSVAFRTHGGLTGQNYAHVLRVCRNEVLRNVLMVEGVLDESTSAKCVAMVSACTARVQVQHEENVLPGGGATSNACTFILPLHPQFDQLKFEAGKQRERQSQTENGTHCEEVTKKQTEIVLEDGLSWRKLSAVGGGTTFGVEEMRGLEATTYLECSPSPPPLSLP